MLAYFLKCLPILQAYKRSTINFIASDIVTPFTTRADTKPCLCRRHRPWGKADGLGPISSACDMGLEGLVSKRSDKPYHSVDHCTGLS